MKQTTFSDGFIFPACYLLEDYHFVDAEFHKLRKQADELQDGSNVQDDRRQE
jgi:hypothetical protein